MARRPVHPRQGLNLAGIGLSVALHAGLAGVALTLPMPDAADWSGSDTRLAFDNAPLMMVDWQPLLEPEPPPQPAQPPQLVEQPTPPQPVVLPPPEPPPAPLRLGIAESQLQTPNWIGFAEETEHSARKSTVVQPSLDPESGAPGVPADQPPVAAPAEPTPPAPPMPEVFHVEHTPPQPQTQPPTPAPIPPSTPGTADAPERPGPVAERPLPPTALPAPTPTLPPDPATQPKDDLVPEGPAREEVRPLRATPGEPGAEPPEPFVGPMPLPGVRGVRTNQPGPDAQVREAQAASAPSPASGPTGVRPAVQPAQPTPGPTTPSPSVQAPPTRVPSGDGAQRPAERSEKQSDATSLEETIEVRLGRPAAAQGLEIFTRRPRLTALTVVTSDPRNPLLRVVFGRTGEVVDVEILESSGVKDIDDPVVNAVFNWTARGPALEKIRSDAPEAGLRVTIRILLR